VAEELEVAELVAAWPGRIAQPYDTALGMDDWIDEGDGVTCPHCFTPEDRKLVDSEVEKQVEDLMDFESEQDLGH